jgi:hypothetical protein
MEGLGRQYLAILFGACSDGKFVASRVGEAYDVYNSEVQIGNSRFEVKKSERGDHMKIRTVLLSLAALFVAVALCFAADVNMGTWKLNDAKSKISPGAGKNTTVVIAPASDSVKVTVDGIGADGKPTHNEWTGKFDGKDYPITGDPASDTRAYKPVNDHTLALTEKKGGKITNTGRVVVSADGKNRTVTASRTDAGGKKISFTYVYDKQ